MGPNRFEKNRDREGGKKERRRRRMKKIQLARGVYHSWLNFKYLTHVGRVATVANPPL